MNRRIGLATAAIAILLLGFAVGWVSRASPERTPSAKLSADPFVGARRLLQGGYDEAAAAETQRVVKASPSVTIPDDLRRLGQPHIWEAWWSRAASFVLYVVLPIVVLVLVLVGWFRKRTSRRQLVLKPFDDSDLGKALPSLLAHRLRRGGPTPRRSMELVSAPIQDLELPAELTDLSPQFKWMSALSRLLFAPDVSTLSGSILPLSERGVGISLILTDRKGQLTSTVELWQQTFDPGFERPPGGGGKPPDHGDDTKPYYHLIGPAAAWLQYSMARKDDVRRLLFGANRWQSAAFFLAGLDWQEQADTDKARYAYIMALASDGGNRAAAVNLAVLEARQNDYGRAILRLRDTCPKIEADPFPLQAPEPRNQTIPDYGWDELWYRSLYTLTVCLYSEWQTGRGDDADVQIEEAFRIGKKAVLVGSSVLDEVRRVGSDWLESQTDFDFHDFLKEIYAANLILLAGMALAANEPDVSFEHAGG